MIVGLTGGIGSGKSTVARAFGERGIAWIDADDVAREVVAPGEPALEEIRKRHGEPVLHDDGTLDRARLREIIFAQPEERAWLEGVTHPRVRERITEHLERMQQEGGPYVLLVSPLLFESGQDALVDVTVVVDIPEEMQLSRTLARDDVSAEQVRAILTAQMPRRVRLARADAVIDNRQDSAHMREQVARLDARLRAMASST